MDDVVLQILSRLTPFMVRRGEVLRDGRVVRWVESGAGSPVVVCDASLGEPGSLAWAGIMPAVAARTRIVAYDRAGLGASDPASPLTLKTQLDDLTGVIQAAGTGPCVVVGHSWGGLLAQLVALRRPELIAGLVLVDPAEEKYLGALPSDVLHEGMAASEQFLAQHANGELEATVREFFADFAQQLSHDQDLQELILDAHAWCYQHEYQARMIRDEHRLVIRSLTAIAGIRAVRRLPDVPVVVFSATTGRPQHERDMWTGFHAELAASVPGGKHIVLPETSHAINQERPELIADAIIDIIEISRPKL
jgi:pimeloyl-ACP methyl ester carboxylesterase